MTEPYVSATERLRLALRRWDDPTVEPERPHWSEGRLTPEDVAEPAQEPTVTLTEDQLADLVEEGALLAMERLVQDLSEWDVTAQKV